MISVTAIQLFGLIVASYLIRRCLSRTSLRHFAQKWWRLLEDSCHAYQFYKVPQFNEFMQENQLYRKILTYLNSLSSVEDSDYANLFSGAKSNDIILAVDENQVVTDEFLGARLYWTNQIPARDDCKALILKIRKRDKRRILRPYLQHIHMVHDELEQMRKEVRLFINADKEPERHGRWISMAFTHPATIDTVVMDSDLKNKIRSDLELFLKSKQYYHRLGRVWKRSYLLYGPSGTGKSSFIAGMAKFLGYDVYDVDLSKLSGDSDLKMLLLQTTPKSVIVVEDLDRYLEEKSTAVSLSGILNFMDGIISCCGEERVMVFTMSGKDQIDPTVLRPGRIDVHIHFSPCDFSAFKLLASNHLGLKEHKLFPQVEEIFQSGSSLSPAEISELMIANRSSPSRALKSVISALQNNADHKLSARIARGLSVGQSGRVTDEAVDTGSLLCREGGNTMKEFRRLYGLLRMRSSRRSSLDFESIEKESTQPENLSR